MNKEKDYKSNYVEDVISLIDMKEDEMRSLLIELYNTPFWDAIKRYNKVRGAIIISSLMTLDPFKYPTNVAQNQGILIGVKDMQDYIIDCIDEIKKKENEQNQK
jgi:hypothetical protein